MAADYPRPDFERTHLRWRSLNGPWDFIFDDEDIGLSQKWQKHGIPAQATVNQGTTTRDGVEADYITQKIAANPQNLIKNNTSADRAARTNSKRSINVPYVFQCPASGINERGEHEVLWYERSIQDPRPSQQDQDAVLLRFGAVDYECSIWIDGNYVGGHRGGHVPFDVDITDALDTTSTTDHRLSIRIYDSAYDLTQPRGKQYWRAQPESIFYSPSSGIWQNVWLETVPSTRIADSSHGTILQSHDLEKGELHARVALSGRKAGQVCAVEIEASLGGMPVKKSEKTSVPVESNYASVDLSLQLSSELQSKLPQSIIQSASTSNDLAWRNGLALWSPDFPTLYDITLRLYDVGEKLIDEVKTSTGMRSISWTQGDSTFRLNGRPLFQSLVLDQGYWPDTFMTPPSADALKADVELSKAMGFNGCRKHQKVEDPIFLYWADKLGYLVWGEMANGYSFSQDYVDRFNQEWIESVKRDINHSSIVAWTPVNESWGYTDLQGNVEQRNHIRTLYYLTKTLDPTRPINDNCGWEHVLTDLTTFHDYADGPDLEKTCMTMEGILGPKAERKVFLDAIKDDVGSKVKEGAPVLCTEFGGVNIKPSSGEAGERDWGYTTASDPADLVKRVEKLIMGVVKGGHCCGYVYTQLADIEQEVNGLYSFDRKAKLDVKAVRDIQERAQKEYYGKHST